MSTKQNDAQASAHSQSQRWDDCKQYLDGSLDIDEYEARERTYEADYESAMIAMSRNSYQEQQRNKEKADFR